MQRVSVSRDVVRLVGSTVSDSSTIAINRTVTVDGSNTKFYRPASGPIFNVTNGYVTFEGVAFEGVNSFSDVAIASGIGTTVRIVASTFDRIAVNATGGAVEARTATFRESEIVCSGGTATIDESTLWSSEFRATNCQATIKRTRFDQADATTLNVSGGVLRVLNSIFVVPSEFVDLVVVQGLGTGSMFAFNTIVNTSSVTDSSVALYCDAPTLEVTSNIFAYNSTNPVTGCTVENSLFDVPAGADANGNVLADATTFFVNSAGGDYRLATTSPAHGIGEPGIVTVDFFGLPRPSPVGSQPDAGAHEAP